MVETFDTIKEQVRQVLVHSQDYPFEDLSLDNLMETWQDKKSFYIKLFGDNLIWRSNEKIHFEIDETYKSSRFNDMLSLLEDKYYRLLYNKSSTGVTFKDFLLQNESGFFDNVVTHEYPDLKIKNGMKLLKCFKYFMPNFNSTRLTQDIASRFIQNNIDGYLYFSVHPMDFLTISENNSSWRSCHSLDGDYRAGNLSYMTDDVTIVVYLADEKKKSFKSLPDGLEWYDKKWRMLIHTNKLKTIVYYSRQYPFDNDFLLRSVYKIITDNFCEDFSEPRCDGFSTVKMGGSWGEIELDHNFILSEDNRIYDTLNTVNEDDFLGYCDLIHSPFYSPVVSVRKHRKLPEGQGRLTNYKIFHYTYDIKIGGKVPCVRCGDRYVERANSFLCNDCIAQEDADEDFYWVCCCCGSRMYPYSDVHTINGEFICDTCFSAIAKEREGVI